MRTSLLMLSALALLAGPFSRSGAAQRTLSHDTLSDETPVAVTCGFCAGERLGAIFRDLPPPARGLDPLEFPIEIEEVQLALAAADAIGSGASYTCSGSTASGQALVGLSVYAGSTIPANIRALPADGPWPGETLVAELLDLPAERSVADEAGSSSYEVNFNRVLLEDEAGLPPRIEAPNVYVRVVVTLAADTALMSLPCDNMSLETPSGFGVRDNDGVVADERNFIYAGGIGWLWNEEVPPGGIDGDWALRLQIRTEGTVPTPDAGAGDGGPSDATPPSVDSGVDGGTPTTSDGGCGCAVSAPSRNTLPWAVVTALVWLRRRRRSVSR